MKFSKKYNWINPGDKIGSYTIVSTEEAKQVGDTITVVVTNTGKIKHMTMAYLLRHPILKGYPKHRVFVKWEFFNNYVVGKTTNTGLVFYLDYDQYEKVKDLPLASHTCKGGRPYVAYRTMTDGKTDNISLIRLFELPYWTRFINGNHMDLRKSNIDTTFRERCNIKNNIPGVWYEPSKKSWVAKINLKYRGDKCITLKRSKDLGECIKARLEAEKKYFNGYAENIKSSGWRQDLYTAWGL